MVDKRCATMILVRPCISLSRASWTTFSDVVSKALALVASSKRRIVGSFNIALAMAIRCFWPPDNCVPRSPTCV
ncbi:hypothetical protein Syun_005435 [Stephania yunnanensis]|uniref:Uncharacterized protein n=1 Tax=Stephania yunnanensis TaxID=152371 RepID=A0AAP0L4S5_9MAGN